MSILILLGSSFAIVFLLGLQSLCVNNGHVRAAMLNSTAIGIANITLLKTAPSADGWEIVAYVVGGPIGILCSLKFFHWYRKRKGKPAVEVSRTPDKSYKAQDDHRIDRGTPVGQNDPRK